MITPFDTTRLYEECERIAIATNPTHRRPGDSRIADVRRVILGLPPRREWSKDGWKTYAARVYGMCRRPKMVPA